MNMTHEQAIAELPGYANMPATIQRAMRRNPEKVCRNRSLGAWRDSDGYWISLAPGWSFDRGGAHVIHEQTATMAAQGFARAVPCDCEDCRK